MEPLLRFDGSLPHDPAVDAWLDAHAGELGTIARHWFNAIRACGPLVRELLHDGHPTACIADAGFAYVNVFKAHVNVGFFRGAQLADPGGLLEGAGKFMRHVKLVPGRGIDAAGLKELIDTAYGDMNKRLAAQETSMKKTDTASGASDLIDQRIAELGGWRGEALARMRKLIREADPQVVEEWKWDNPVWSHGGILCTGESYKAKVKLTFAKGASVKDPSGLFNSSLDGNVRRAIDIAEGDEVDAAAFKALVKAAVAVNAAAAKARK